MDQVEKCPICGGVHKIQSVTDGTIFWCQNDRRYYLCDGYCNGADNVEKERRLNIVYNYIEKYPFYNNNDYWKFYYDKSENNYGDDCFVNIYQLMKNYPYQVIDRIDHIMINLSRRFPLLSDYFSFNEILCNCQRLFYCESNNKFAEISSLLSTLLKMEYIEIIHRGPDGMYSHYRILIERRKRTYYRISIEGWKRIAELTKNQSVYNYGFIAMSFDDKVKYIGEIFKGAIQAKGYEPRIIKDIEHNNYIMPEIFYEIQRSKFVVVDVTEPNYGAYYEAGYAQALGKEVIVCCKEEVFNDRKPHFDIAQKSMIIWKNEEDLYDRLTKRIEATVK